MPVCNYPVVSWKDEAGYCTALLLDINGHDAAYEKVHRKAYTVLKSRIRNASNWDGSPLAYEDFLIPEPSRVRHWQVRVSIRPQYQVGERRFPLGRTYRLAFDCFAGPNLAGDLGCCFVPILGLAFDYYLQDERLLDDMITHRVINRLGGAAPEALVPYLRPVVMVHENLPVMSKRKTGVVPWRQMQQAMLPTLTECAEPLSREEISRQHNKALHRESDASKIGSAIENGENLMLVGGHGIGKSAIFCSAVVELERNRKNQAPRFWLTSPSRIVSGMRYLGEWEERCESIIKEIETIGGVLCFPDLHELMSVGGEAVESSMAAYFLRFLRDRRLRMVVEATPESLAAARRLFPEFVGVFRIQMIEALPRREDLAVVERTLKDRADSARVDVEDQIIGMIYRFFERFEPYRSQPGPACDFAKRLLARILRNKGKSLTREIVTSLYQERSGLPRALLDDNQTLTHAMVYDSLRERVKGQESACGAMADNILRLKAGLNDPARPLGVHLFAGPTGVGKTQLVKVVADYLFGHGSGSRLVRLDMSEYAGPGAADRLLGTFSEQPGPLVREIRGQPFSVLLLDEIEKAAPEVFDVFMSIFDEGRHTDRFGRLTYFNSCLIIMTSNLGVRHTGGLGFNASADGDAEFRKAVMDFFRPEFFNRMDGIVSFSPLPAEVVREIAFKEIADYAGREAFRLRKLQLDVAPDVLDRILARGFNEKLGARPLQRVIEDFITTPVARFLAENPDANGVVLRVESDVGGGTVAVIVDP